MHCAYKLELDTYKICLLLYLLTIKQKKEKKNYHIYHHMGKCALRVSLKIHIMLWNDLWAKRFNVHTIYKISTKQQGLLRNNLDFPFKQRKNSKNRGFGEIFHFLLWKSSARNFSHCSFVTWKKNQNYCNQTLRNRDLLTTIKTKKRFIGYMC